MKEKKSEITSKNSGKSPQNEILQSIDSFFSHSSLKGLIQQMDGFFGQAFTDVSLPVETKETNTEFLVICKLPGVKKDQITIETFDRYLTISVKNEEQLETIDEGSSYMSKRYSLNKSKRTIPVPDYVKIQSLKANYRDGLLKISIPKKDIRQIKIED